MILGNYVPGEGPSNAKLAIIGEAPGGDEEAAQRPFVGPTGRMVDSLIVEASESVGIPLSREDVYLTNVVKHRPPNNKIERLGELGKSVQDYIPQLFEEITKLNPNCILGLGNTALEALTGHKGIQKYRGSIYQSNFGPKCVNSIHPASLLHGESDGRMKNWKDLTFIRWDFERAIKQSQSSEFDPPRRNLYVCRSSTVFQRFLNSYHGSKYLSVDIETFRTIPICIGLAFSRHEAISIPLFDVASPTNPNGIPRSDLLFIWQMLAELLYNPAILKIGQNFKFDELQLDTCVNLTCPFGLKVNGFYFDTGLAFRILYPELDQKLAFQTSVLTEEPYYKDDGKEFWNPKKNKGKSHFEQLLIYNARDAAVTFECYEKELEELQERGLDEFFFTFQMPFHPFYATVERHGILRDTFQHHFLEEKYKAQLEEKQGELDELTEVDGIRLNPNSPKQCQVYFYQVMKIPSREGTDEDTLEALLRNVVKDERKRRILELTLEVRKIRKTIGTYINCKSHPDGRIRTAFRIILETGRTSTSVLKSPVTTEPLGLAFQTITKHGDVGADLRSQFIPDPGYVFIEPDLSQAEARVVAILARDKLLQKMFEYRIDVHRVTAGWIDGKTPNELMELFLTEEDKVQILALAKEINGILKGRIDDDARQGGKKFRHAGHYDMGKREASVQTGLSEWKTGKILERFHATNPNIRNVFHKEIQEALRDNNRVLCNPFGRARIFLNKWGNDLFKEAYAQIPQSTVSDQTKKAARNLVRRHHFVKVLSESHDSFLAMVPIHREDEIIPSMIEFLEEPIDFSRCTLSRGELIIPCEIYHSPTNWLSMEKIYG